MPAREVVARFVQMVEPCEFLAAYEEFYADDATAQENTQPLRQGKPALLEHERKMLASSPELPEVRAQSLVLAGDQVAINWVVEFTDRQGRKRHLDEVALQVWRGDQIIRERFFYDQSLR